MEPHKTLAQEAEPPTHRLPEPGLSRGRDSGVQVAASDFSGRGLNWQS